MTKITTDHDKCIHGYVKGREMKKLLQLLLTFRSMQMLNSNRTIKHNQTERECLACYQQWLLTSAPMGMMPGGLIKRQGCR